jgi:pullulanase/glycogen debranching enzyme
MRHPGIPPELRGTYAGLGHDAALAHLVGLGVTAVELLPVHQHVPEAMVVERGLTNYWATTPSASSPPRWPARTAASTGCRPSST